MLRTFKNNELKKSNLDQKVRLTGWVSTARDHGGLIFIDLRDRWGITQLVFNPDTDAQMHQSAKALRSEDCIGIEGVVALRPEGTVNTKLPTGEIEIAVSELQIFSKSETPPFEIDSDEIQSEELRLKYRFLDLRKAPMQKALLFRSRFIHEVRKYLQDQEFVEIDTPILTKSTPEGARDYLVPSRVHPGSFFALPQSPQLFKQILMVSGYDRYFQIAKCFRDEDLRADRQPEFSQIDFEMSFAEQNDVFSVVEGLLKQACENTAQIEVKTPFPRMPYAEAISRFGSDKPDLRFGLELRNVTDVFKGTAFKIFKQTVDGGGAILALHVPAAADKFSRKHLDELIEYSKEHGGSGLAYIKIGKEGLESPIAKFFTDEETASLKEMMPQQVQTGDIVFFAADRLSVAGKVLGAVRIEVARRLSMIPAGVFNWVWITDFPLFHYNEEESRWESEHHPFTSPLTEDIDKLGVDNSAIRSSSYDLVLNGNELASGSIRIHSRDVQKKIFEIIGLDSQEVQKRFGFLLSAFEYGPPPHAGAAVGLDRLLTLLLGRDSIREVIAFPKTQRAVCPMTSAPSDIPSTQLKELSIRLT